MKLKFSERQTTRAIYIFLILAAAILLVFLLINFSGVCAFFNTVLGILAPFLIGIVLAYLLHFPTRFFEKHLFRFVHGKKSRPKLARGLSITLSILLLLGVCTAFIVSIFPEMAANITTLVVGLPEYLKSFNQTVQNLLHSMHFSEEVIQQFALSWEDIVVQLTSYLKTTIPDLVNASIDLTVSLSNFFIGLIVSVYLLFSQEKFIAQTKKFIYAFTPKRFADGFLRIGRRANSVFSGFIVARLLDGLIVGVLCFIGMTIMQMPYTLLISVFIGVTNIIPFFGPFIGAIPSIIILLLVNPMQALWFTIFIVVIQQIDGQIIGPRVLGNSIGLSAFWVIFSLLVGVGLFGFAGLILGVPIFAILYAMIREAIGNRLTKKGMSNDTKDYFPEPPPKKERKKS